MIPTNGDIRDFLLTNWFSVGMIDYEVSKPLTSRITAVIVIFLRL
jgi:hypothetical protein